jgi:hypothetical protein
MHTKYDIRQTTHLLGGNRKTSPYVT